MAELLKKNLAIVINLIIMIIALSFGYGLLQNDVRNCKEDVAQNERCIEQMRKEWQRDVKIILEKCSTLEGYVKGKSERNTYANRRENE